MCSRIDLCDLGNTYKSMSLQNGTTRRDLSMSKFWMSVRARCERKQVLCFARSTTGTPWAASLVAWGYVFGDFVHVYPSRWRPDHEPTLLPFRELQSLLHPPRPELKRSINYVSPLRSMRRCGANCHRASQIIFLTDDDIPSFANLYESTTEVFRFSVKQERFPPLTLVHSPGPLTSSKYRIAASTLAIRPGDFFIFIFKPCLADCRISTQ
ncbi:hypothetical protein EDB86DRAFT_2941234 [Lactarius hatsudake]|nr:hypothetical protein EDB86DRAFT_2941234 [Lactarius hatsudake]